MSEKIRAPRNRTLTIASEEAGALLSKTIKLDKNVAPEQLENQVIFQDLFECVKYFPEKFIDLLIIDPPYNLDKKFGKNKFAKTNSQSYEEWVESWVKMLKPCLKVNASIYVCCDWQSSVSIFHVLEKHFQVKNRITWEREKGRGSLTNWKNCSEDIWFCVNSDNYHFNVNAVKLKRKVIAPYKDKAGSPKDWEETIDGNFRLTHPSNLWTDLTIPFWSMPENTDHPTQKPEKLIAKLILASSEKDGLVFDPFLGSGTTAVVAKKLGRKFLGVEREAEYCEMSIKRLQLADSDNTIQGYHDGYFWERNSLNEQTKSISTKRSVSEGKGLFE